ncbi:MAG: TfoX/Sxy family protein [Clostridia bacterium]|nr:TfoX/Sxy family protein [Clostridia bacterium]
MASSPEFVRYVAEQMGMAGVIAYRKMFGEYGLYCDGKFFAMICDDQLFFKPTEQARSLAAELHVDVLEAPPYSGARNALLVENVDNREALSALARATCDALAENKAKGARRKGKNAPKET